MEKGCCAFSPFSKPIRFSWVNAVFFSPHDFVLEEHQAQYELNQVSDLNAMLMSLAPIFKSK